MTINERLKFLIKELNLSVRAFSAVLEVPDTNTRNYLSKGTKLNSEYLERIAHHFKQVNLSWLITGNGEPLTLMGQNLAPQTQTSISGDRNNVTSGKNSKAIQKNYGLSDCEKERDDYKAERDSYKAQLELMASQLADKERTIQILLKQHV